jgi:hypothetical protein
MMEGWNQTIDSNQKSECPSLAFPPQGQISSEAFLNLVGLPSKSRDPKDRLRCLFHFPETLHGGFNGLTGNLGPIQAPDLSSNSYELKNKKNGEDKISKN